jgi:hypothetical protein
MSKSIYICERISNNKNSNIKILQTICSNLTPDILHQPCENTIYSDGNISWAVCNETVPDRQLIPHLFLGVSLDENNTDWTEPE